MTCPNCKGRGSYEIDHPYEGRKTIVCMTCKGAGNVSEKYWKWVHPDVPVPRERD